MTSGEPLRMIQQCVCSDGAAPAVRWWLILLILLLVPASARAQTAPLVLQHDDSTYVLHRHLGVLVDSTGHLDWTSVAEADTSLFQAASAPSVAAAGPRTVFWMRLRLRSELDEATHWRLRLLVDSAEVRLFDEGGYLEGRLLTGHGVPVNQRSVRVAFPPSVEFTVPSRGERVLVARLKVGYGTYTAGDGALHTPELRPARRARAEAMQGRLGQGLFLGFMLAMLGYNLFLFTSVRDRGYLWYVVFLGCFTSFWLLHYGYVQEWAWPAGISTHLDLQFYLIPVGFAAYLLFTQHFLGTHARVPWLHRVSQGILVLLAVPPLLGLLGWWPAATMGAAVLALVVVGVTTGIGLRVLLVSGFSPARFYFGACLFFIAGTFIYTLTWMGVFPVNVFTKYSIQIGSACEAFLLSLGLAARINLMREETRVAQVRMAEAEKSQRALEEANRIKTELMGIAAHDLRSPLMAIRDFSDIVREEVGYVESVDEPLHLIRSAAERMLRLVDDLLVTAVLDSGRTPVRREEANLVVVTREVVATYLPRAERKGQRLLLHAGAPVDDVVVDVVRLRNAIDNLVSNALKYAPPDTDVEVEVTQTGGEVQVAVHDRGPGLTQEDLEKVFQPYQRLSAEPTGGEDSTGLGLSITKQIVEVHGGRVWVDSEYGRGSTFGFALPTAEVAELPPQSRVASRV